MTACHGGCIKLAGLLTMGDLEGALHRRVVNHTGTSDGKFLEGNRISHGLSDAGTSEACKQPLELSRTLSDPAGHSRCKRSRPIYLSSGMTMPSAFIKDRGQKKSTSAHADNQEVDRWRWILHLNFTGICKKNIFLAFLFSFMALSSGFNEDKHAYCHVHSEMDLPEWRLTCQFQEDLRESRQTFQVYRIKHAGSPDVVVDGIWMKDEPAIFTAVGYTHDGLISDKVVIKMQKEIVHHGGIYACVFPSEKLQNVNTCQVPKLEELPSTRRTTTPIYVPMTDEGTRLVAFKELLMATISLIIYEKF